MALPYKHLLWVVMMFFIVPLKAQTVYYPVHSSELLRATAADMASLLSKATASTINIQSYTTLPAQGIIFIYDSTVSGNQSCRINGNGINLLTFSAPEDNGLCFGIYSYLKSSGFKFYLPGDIWEKVPALTGVFREINTTVSGKYKYNNWSISGGHNLWAMDNDNTTNWEVYFGKNGHAWAKYQRRNNMNGEYRFSGHRGDIMNEQFVNVLRQNPCYVASFDNSREATGRSVPDIHNAHAKSLWASAIGDKAKNYRNTIHSNTQLYANLFRNFKYYNQNIGIEVADGARWGNSAASHSCPSGNYNGNPYPKPSEQQGILAAYTVEKLKLQHPGASFQTYAYSTHADVPTFTRLPEGLDVQVVPTAFQSFTSAKALMKRWYSVSGRISEYHYANIPQWTSEAPMFSFEQYKQTLKRVRMMNSQGLFVEASPAKFATLPFLHAGNNFLQDNIDPDTSVNEFVNAMFPAAASKHILQLLRDFSDEDVFGVGSFIADNKYKIPMYLQTMSKAITAAGPNVSETVAARLRELKAYLHYIVLHYDLITDTRTYTDKSEKAYRLCLYLARINKMRLVNSAYLIAQILRKYPATDPLQTALNIVNGTAYENGQLELITATEIDQNFSNDLFIYGNTIPEYHLSQVQEILSKAKGRGLQPLNTISFRLQYTNGYEYPNRSELYFQATKSGIITIAADVQSLHDGGFLNIAVEANDDPLTVLADTTVYPGSGSRSIRINIARAGVYKLSFVSKHQTTADVKINTNGYMFFRRGAFYGHKTENYRADLKSLPRFFYVPPSISRIFFSVTNGCVNGVCADATAIAKTFWMKDNKGDTVKIDNTSDPMLFSIAVNQNAGAFWEVQKMEQYNLSFANISNVELYAERASCLLCIESAPLPDSRSINVFPNPSRSTFNFRIQDGKPVQRILLSDGSGRKVAEFSNTDMVNVSTFAAGVYSYRVLSGNSWYVGKLIKL